MPMRPTDFLEFLRLLNAHRVEYLLVGGLPSRCMAIPEPPPTWTCGGVAPLLTSIDGVDFDECVDRAVETTVEGVPIAVIGLSDLKLNKRSSGRPKDLADLEALP